MMTTIDHRILIPVPQAQVWDYLRKLNNNPRWQTDCKALAILTSKSEGVGVRWRETSAGGREFVAEIRAWYDGLGYQYTFVDRPPFRSAIGTLRLQEIPEGTIVQWTLEYETGGLLSGMRNALGLSRQLDATIQGSLKKLYLQLKTDRARVIEPSLDTKSLMRDAPDADARANYKPRHPTINVKDAEPQKPPKPVTLGPVDEPPLEDHDTRPTRTVATVDVSAAAPAELTLSEPDFLANLPPVKRDDTEPLRGTLGHAQMIDVAAVQRELEDQTAEQKPITTNIAKELAAAALDIARDESPTIASREGLVNPPDPRTIGSQRLPEAQEPELLDEVSDPFGIEQLKTEGPREIISIPEPAPTDSERLMDTSKMSIWEVFGIPRPSEGDIQRMIQPAAPPAAIDTPDDAVDVDEAVHITPQSGRRHPGLRWVLRRKRARLRRYQD